MTETSQYPETADVETSSEDYARRFAGPAGEWMLSVQERLFFNLLGSPDGEFSVQRSAFRVLDVGGGHGQLALPMAEQGIAVTVLGSAPECAARLQPALDEKKLEFRVGNVIELPFEDQSFDAVVSVRLLPHCGQWKKLVEELCRVARRTVIVDYPTGQSLNCLSGALFGAKKKLEGNTRPFTLFSHAEVRQAFDQQGFRAAGRRAEFFVPMVVHRMLKCPAVSRMVEAVCAVFGLRHLLGSPVVARFDRKDG